MKGKAPNSNCLVEWFNIIWYELEWPICDYSFNSKAPVSSVNEPGDALLAWEMANSPLHNMQHAMNSLIFVASNWII